jgi:very-short-patch-repair endonuclease
MTGVVDRYTRQAVEARGWRSGTTLENRVAVFLSRFGMGPDLITQQYRVGRYKVDFADVRKKIVIEADGWYHRSPEGAARDAERDSWLRAQGWLVVRVDDRHGEEALEIQVARVARLLRADTWHADG